jgi:deoxyribodipyrimidine photo-lyase
MTVIEKLSRDPRVTVRRSGSPNAGGDCVVYWMQRAQRAFDNPALDVAVSVANELRKPVVVFFAPVPFCPKANDRHFRFLADGIAEIAEGLAKRQIGFVFRFYPEHRLLTFCAEANPCIVIGDENPLREAERWRSRVTRDLQVPFWTVDADVVVPSKLLEKEHYGARTIRPRLHQLLPQFLKRSGNPAAHVLWTAPPGLREQSWNVDFTRDWTIDRNIAPPSGWRGGSKESLRRLKLFLDARLAGYPDHRSRPDIDGTSRISPYLHFGHLGPLTVALAVETASAPAAAKEAFLEQLIVRRELAVNFVRFNPLYDSMECLEPWADHSFARHASDRRPMLYSENQLENAETHDPLWNAAQKQLVLAGWIHNYLRMYWAKKILEWSPSVTAAYQRAIWLNDRHQVDGRDPNGYAGIAWAIVGKHDRPWFERPVFGQVRYMSLASTGRKFDSKAYIEHVQKLERSHV